eukprot:CAMPEP_0171232302 /NCGR_PEP_ID=MMETSP0790-20130122/40341_1 /TAXON_ID=2925 /ORGANISM="Alexandrium catenella, Strain OF101" /LENGTH=439 /DNA_ID=CAMNT_0011698539 /DNA_START=127 /DNA_END=1446 /DNA_ORIENTATION=+
MGAARRLVPLLCALQWSLCSALRNQQSSSADSGDSASRAFGSIDDDYSPSEEDELSVLFANVESAESGERQALPFCTEYKDSSLRYTCAHFRLGNALLQYWNARGYALLEGMDFMSTSNRTDMVSAFPKKTPASQPSPMQRRLWRELRSAGDNCVSCPFPQGKAYGPWRFIGDTILNETMAAVQQQAAIDPRKTRLFTTWSGRQTWAVLHQRCDRTIWTNEQYGFLRYGFLRDHLPLGTTHMLIVGQVQYSDPLCQRLADDLVSWLKVDLQLSVEFQYTNVRQDWLTLATAPVLFCSISTFCLTAGLGNPNRVHFPVNGENMVVQEDGPELQEARLLRSPGFHWVPYDFVPGTLAIATPWDRVRGYLRAKACSHGHPCVPVGGEIPDKYRVRDPAGLYRRIRQKFRAGVSLSRRELERVELGLETTAMSAELSASLDEM